MSLWGSTPQADYGAVPSKETSADKPTVSRADYSQLLKKAESSDWTWKILGMFGGVAMMVTGAINFTQQIQDFNGFAGIFDLYIIFFGILTMGLEFKDEILSVSWRNTLRVDAKFMYKPFGRAILYVFFGVLLLSQQPFMYICTGIYLVAVGGLVIHAAQATQQEIDAFKAKKKTPAELKEHYEAADTKKEGLTVQELASVVCGFEGNSMSQNEVTSALMMVDKKNTGKISCEDFIKWYTS